MRPNDRKWEANREKVAFARDFPGRVVDLHDAVGKSIAEVRDLVGATGVSAILFTDHTFHLGQSGREPMPADLLRALEELRPVLEPNYADAFRRLDELSETDRELTRQARLENILGAIRTNIDAMPELANRVRVLLDKLESGAGDCRALPGNEESGSGAGDA